MDRSRFDLCADRFQAYAKALQVTAGDCVAQATNLISGEQPTDRAEGSPVTSGASVALGRVCGRIEDVMVAYDQLQESVGGETRYKQVLVQLGARPEPGASAPAPSD